MTLLWASLLSLVTGVSLGLLGGGGSILTVPILVYVLGLPPRSAIATSMVVVGATSLVGALTHARAGRVRWRQGLFFGAAGMVGALVGGRLGKLVPQGLLLVVFAAMILATAFAMLRPRKVPQPGEAPKEVPRTRRLLRVARDGMGVGVLTGLVGAGGGFMVVPALALLGGLEMAEAVATSLLVITLNSTAGLVSTQLAGVPLDWAVAGGMSAASILGSLLGARLGRGLSPQTLRRAFAWFVVALGLFIFAREMSSLLALPSPSAGLVAGVLGTVVVGASVALGIRRAQRARASSNLRSP